MRIVFFVHSAVSDWNHGNAHFLRGLMSALTRMGHASRIVVTGDLTQTDLPRTVRSGLADAVHRLRDVDGLSIVYLDQTDIVRNPIVTRIVKAYEEDGARTRKSSG